MNSLDGCLSLVPPLIAITLAIVSQRVVLSLFVGVLSGALILTGGDPLTAAADTLELFIWSALTDEDHLRVFAFTLLMGAMVEVIRQSGGMLAIVNQLASVARGRRSGQLMTWFLGLIIFFDDYANTLLLGTTMRELCDRLKISREKLAYLVDSTAAPVAGLAIVSTWVAGEIGYINAGLHGLTFSGQTPQGFELFIVSIPYRFYVLCSLLLVPLIALSGRDFGPMLIAERQVLQQPNNIGITELSTIVNDELPEGTRCSRWTDALIPVFVMIAVTIWLMIATGRAALVDESMASSSTWMSIIGNANAYVALLYGSLAGLITAFTLVVVGRTLTLSKAQQAAMDGAKLMLPALVILLLAWSLSKVTSEEYLGTGITVGNFLKQNLQPQWLPTIVFIMAGMISFCTGTSWGTMGILMPLVIPVSHQMLSTSGPVSSDDSLLIASVASVLAGAIFGDHCSPISDTTILSSQASGCDHIAHVKTQLPYALLSAIIAILCGTIPVGFGVPVYICLLLGTVTLVIVLFIVGDRAES